MASIDFTFSREPPREYPGPEEQPDPDSRYITITNAVKYATLFFLTQRGVCL